MRFSLVSQSGKVGVFLLRREATSGGTADLQHPLDLNKKVEKVCVTVLVHE